MGRVNKNITLEEKMGKYDKESLRLIARRMGLAKEKKLKKEEMVAYITDKLMDSHEIFNRMSVLTDNEMAKFERQNGFATEKDSRYFRMLVGDYGLIIKHESEDSDPKYEFFIPSDVMDKWKTLKTDKFMRYREKSLWLWKCVTWCNELYGLYSMKDLFDVVNTNEKFKMDIKEIDEMLDSIVVLNMFVIRHEDKFIKVFRKDTFIEELKNVFKSDDDFYIPTKEEIEEFFTTNALLSESSYGNLHDFMAGDLLISQEDTVDILTDLWLMTSQVHNMAEVLHWLLTKVHWKNENQRERLILLYNSVFNRTRTMFLKGHTPEEKNNE